MKHFKLIHLVMLAVMLLIPVVSKAQSQAPLNMKGYKGNNGNVYTFQVTGKSNLWPQQLSFTVAQWHNIHTIWLMGWELQIIPIE